jgi:molybdopterin-guanine dinucleotide biosynthesis protein A
LDKSAIILTSGFPTALNQDKGVLRLANKPLIARVIETVNSIVGETIVVTDSQEKKTKYEKLVAPDTRFVVDVCESQGPLIGVLTGFESAKGKYSLLLRFDTPFASSEVISLLFELCIGKAAAIPRWPSQKIESLLAVYQTRLALEAAKSVVNEGKNNLDSMIEKLRGVRYVSTLVIQQLDPELRTFFNINTPLDLNRAIAMLKPRKLQ